VAASINIEVYSDALVVLGTAGIVVPLVRRFGLSPVLGYLAAGAILGPLGLGSLIKQFPFLYWLTVVDAKNVAGIARVVSLDEIAANDHNLNIPRYVESKNEQVVLTVEEAMKRLRTSAEAAFEAEGRLVGILKREGLLV
jgi:hypothetical protein